MRRFGEDSTAYTWPETQEWYGPRAEEAWEQSPVATISLEVEARQRYFFEQMKKNRAFLRKTLPEQTIRAPGSTEKSRASK